MKINKVWNIKTDLHIGSTAEPFTMVQNDMYAYVLNLKFVRNRRAISSAEDLTGKIFLHFFLPAGEQVVELVDIEYDEATFPIPNEFLLSAGEAYLYIEERENGVVVNNPNNVDFTIQVSPWEVS